MKCQGAVSKTAGLTTSHPTETLLSVGLKGLTTHTASTPGAESAEQLGSDGLHKTSLSSVRTVELIFIRTSSWLILIKEGMQKQ